jgi:hypothetical protein
VVYRRRRKLLRWMQVPPVGSASVSAASATRAAARRAREHGWWTSIAVGGRLLRFVVLCGRCAERSVRPCRHPGCHELAVGSYYCTSHRSRRARYARENAFVHKSSNTVA